MVQGTAIAEAIATGPHSEIGRIGKALAALGPEATPLQRQSRRLVGVLGDAAPSEAHVSRLVRTPPERLNLVTLDALCVVLSCGPGDLLRRGDWAEAAS